MPNPPIPEKSRRSSIQSIDRATAILKALASGPRRLGVSELAERLGLARPTVHGLLQTLQTHGFVEQDRQSDQVPAGARPPAARLLLPRLERAPRALDRLRRQARPLGQAAAVRVGVTHGLSVVVVHHVFRPDAAFGVLEVGLPAAFARQRPGQSDPRVLLRAGAR